MTALSGVEIQLVGYAENTKRSKVTGSQDDDSVEALQYRQSEAVSAILEEDQTHHLSGVHQPRSTSSVLVSRPHSDEHLLVYLLSRAPVQASRKSVSSVRPQISTCRCSATFAVP